MEQAKEYDSAVAADPSAQSSPVEMPRRNVVPSESRPLKAIIGPHAGYSYCGHVMAHAYGHIDASRVKRIFLLGPSHHVYSRRCFLSTADAYETPLGPLRIDKELVAELRGSGIFDDMPLSVDEAEHSLELHTSFIASVMKNAPHDFTLVPIMVGAISAER
jgi:AmmeMemoRadiSam system protein B